MESTLKDSYLTLAAPAVHEIKVKGSRFIACGFPIIDESDAQARLTEIRKKEFAATHHCFAHVLGLDGAQFKYSDAGEPSGTAGKPIFQAITGRRLTNVLVVVVRYFGGTKLGTGNLARAYSQATADMLDKAEIVEKLVCDRLRFAVELSLYDNLMRLIGAGKYAIVAQDFSDRARLTVDVRKSRVERFTTQLLELTGGRVEIEKVD